VLLLIPVLHLDHVILLVRSVDAWAATLEREWGLRTCEGGTHPGGTRTRIAPLQPPHYIEVMGLVGHERGTPLASALARRLEERGDHFVGWAVSTDDVEAEGRRLGRVPESGGGATVRWRTVRPATADADHLPFFIQYDGETAMAYLRRQAEEANSPARPGSFAWIELATDPSALAEWLGPHDLPIRIVSGTRGLRAVGINSPAEMIEIRTSE
jgi:hypothetical protein